MVKHQGEVRDISETVVSQTVKPWSLWFDVTRCAKTQSRWDFLCRGVSLLRLPFHSSCPLLVAIQLQPSGQRDGSFQTLPQWLCSASGAGFKPWEGNNEVESLPAAILDWQAEDRGNSLSQARQARGLRSDDGVCRRQKYPWHRVYSCVCHRVQKCGSPQIFFMRVMHVWYAEMLKFRSLPKCSSVLLLSKKETLENKRSWGNNYDLFLLYIGWICSINSLEWMKISLRALDALLKKNKTKKKQTQIDKRNWLQNTLASTYYQLVCICILRC